MKALSEMFFSYFTRLRSSIFSQPLELFTFATVTASIDVRSVLIKMIAANDNYASKKSIDENNFLCIHLFSAIYSIKYVHKLPHK